MATNRQRSGLEFANDILHIISSANPIIGPIHELGIGYAIESDGLEQILVHAKSFGMKTTITTNGTTLYKERLCKIKEYIDFIAISLDGPPRVHNKIRGSKYAFDKLLLGLENVRDTGIKFGFIHTLTRESWEHLLWICEFVANHNATLFQIHPLELEGRADIMMQSNTVNDDILARVYLITLVLASKYKGSMVIQFDAFRRDYVLKNPESVYSSELYYNSSNTNDIKLADLLNFLVVEADGSVVPIAYNFSKRYKLCNIKNQRLSEIWPAYLRRQEGGYMMFRKLCQEVFREISTNSLSNEPLLPFFNWYELIVSRSNKLFPD